jgi:Domain of unknown function (DUF4124)
MRQRAALLSMLIALSATGAEMWRWKDADGVTHYSDRPVEGAERMEVRSQNSTGEIAARPRAPVVLPPPPPPLFNYARCLVTVPNNDQVFNNMNTVQAAIAVEPDLQAGHQLQVLLNGQPDPQWQSGTRARLLVNLNRGSYTLAVRVLDASGRTVCASPIVNFHVRQPSLLAPGRRPPAKKP